MGLSLATEASPDKFSIILLAGNVNKYAITNPKIPLHKPINIVSALNTLVISLARAPNALKIQISLVLSKTDI